MGGWGTGILLFIWWLRYHCFNCFMIIFSIRLCRLPEGSYVYRCSSMIVNQWWLIIPCIRSNGKYTVRT